MKNEKNIYILFSKIKKLEKEIKQLKNEKKNNTETQTYYTQNDDGTYTLKYTIPVPAKLFHTSTEPFNTPFFSFINLPTSS